MEKTFAVLSTQANIDERALQAVFQEYSGQLEHLAVFSTENINDVTHLQEDPTYTFPIDYSQAILVIGESDYFEHR